MEAIIRTLIKRGAILSCLLAFLGVYGCASNLKQPLSATDRNLVSQAPVINVVHYRHRTNMTTPTDALVTGGLFYYTGPTAGEGANLAASKQREQAWPEVSALIKTNMIKGLQQRGRVANLKATNAPAEIVLSPSFYHGPGDTMAAYKRSYGSSLVLDIRSLVVSHYTLSSRKDYTFGVTAKAVLVRPSDGKIFWKGMCVVDKVNGSLFKFQPGNKSAAEAKRVRNFLYDAGRRCADQLVAQYLVQG